jgi:hypothetical protein
MIVLYKYIHRLSLQINLITILICLLTSLLAIYSIPRRRENVKVWGINLLLMKCDSETTAKVDGEKINLVGIESSVVCCA